MMQGNAFQGQSQPEQPEQAAYTPHPDEIMGGHKAVDATMDGLIELVSLPKGELTKKHVFDSVSEMIAKGAFPTPEAKKQVIGELANLPDEEQGIRKVLGQYLLSVATFRNHMHSAFGPPQEVNPLQQSQPAADMGAPPASGMQ